MYHPIPPEKIEKAKILLKQGYSIRSAAQSSGISFTSARKIYNGLPVGVGWAKNEKRVQAQGRFFNVNQMCWITGFEISYK